MFIPGRDISREQRSGRVRLMALALLISCSFVISGASLVFAQEEEIPRAGTPLNSGGFANPARQFLSAGAMLALEQATAARLSEPDPYLSAVAASNASAGATSAQQVPFRNPAPAFSRNLLISRNFGYSPFQTEPHIAVDPLDPEHLIVGLIDYNMGSTMSTYTSFDGGESWQGPVQVPRFREDVQGAGDPVVAFESDGSAYITMLSLGVRDFQIGSIASDALVLNMAVSKSNDGGLSWSDPILASEGSVTTVSEIDDAGKERGTVTFLDLDKPWMAVGPHPDDPESELIYLSYTEFESTYSIIYADEVAFFSTPILATTIKVVASEDGGASWSDPVAASPKVLYGFGVANPPGMDQTLQNQAGESGLATRVVQGSQVAILPDGTLATAWYDSTDDGVDTGLATVMVAMSSDSAQTFSDPVQAGVYREVPFRLRTANFRYGALPAMAAGPDGEIYIVQSGRPVERSNDDSDIYLYRTFDKAQTWEEPVLLNQDGTNANQFFPQITTSPDGIIHVMWGDQRDDPVRLRYHIYYSQSTDQGETWGFTLPDQNFTVPDTRVTDFPSNPMRGFPGGRFIGDYFGIAATGEDVYLVWADTRLGEFGGFNQQIGFARKTAIEPPSLFISPPSGSAGRIVDIQGFGFQPEASIQLYVSGVATSFLTTDSEGQFQTSIYMPLTGEGPTQISAFDETGNVATASFFTEFGFDTLQRSLEEINSQLGVTEEIAATPAASPVPTDGTPTATGEGDGSGTTPGDVPSPPPDPDDTNPDTD
ncbi:hypothetical protein BH24CHL4_BH24CHL4_16220 [soil metagenome]